MPQPLFSIIIPTYQRPERLTACLEAIGQLEAPAQGFEVVVVDDGSDGAANTAAAAKTAFPLLSLRYIIQEHGGPSKARNRGAECASGRYLAFIDDDCRPDRDWLRHLAAALDGPKRLLVGGRVVNALKDNRFAVASQALMSYMYSFYLRQERPFFASCNLALSRENFRHVGGFDTRFPLAAGEDREFCRRSRLQGLQLVYVDGALVHHHHALGLGTFVRQHFNYGRGAMFYHRLRRKSSPGKGAIEPAGFYLGLLRSPFSDSGCRRPWWTSFLLALAQPATATGFCYEWFSRRQSHS